MKLGKVATSIIAFSLAMLSVNAIVLQEAKEDQSVEVIGQDVLNEHTSYPERVSLNNSCKDHECPKVKFKACPKECLLTCYFKNANDPCCPFSGEPTCLD